MQNRRKFFQTATAGAIGSSLLLGCAYESNLQHDTADTRYQKLDEILAQPVLKRDLFPEPVIIEKMQLLEYNGNFLCTVTDSQGRQGISVSTNLRMRKLYPIFLENVAPFFIGKDARDLDTLMEQIYVHDSNYKMQGYPIWVPVATAEFAILDLLGKISNRSMGALIGTIHNEWIGVYQANNFRGKSAEESIQLIQQQMEETSSNALKFKVGGRMSNNKDYPPGRTEALIPLVRKTFGDDMTIYADSNGSYTVEEAIRIGKLMEEYHFDFYEEPVPFDWYEETRTVSKALKVPIAGGEQEGSMHNFRWLIGNHALDIVQPDPFYFGGMVRSMKVAQMANVFKKPCVPHISGSGLGYLYMMHFVAALPNAGPYHEFKGFNGEIPISCPTSDLQIKEGKIKVPTGPGLGVEIDPDYILKHQEVKKF